MKRSLILLHRWLGAALCLLFAVWFASGMVMVFAGFPHLDEERRLDALPELAADPSLPSPATAFASVAADGGRVRLGTLGRRAVYRLVDRAAAGGGRAGLVDARDARAAVVADADQIAGLAAAYLMARGAPARRLAPRADDADLQVRDQWTPAAPAMALFPLRRFEVAGDAIGDQVYVSLRTAEVVQATTRHARLWAWLGAIPHWIYPIALRRHAETWRHVVLALAGLGVLLALSGLTVGLWHWRPFGAGFPGRDGVAASASPYRATWMRWHHTLGLVFGCLVFTWIGSGALSLNPFHWSRGSGPSRADALAFSAGPLQIGRFVLPPARAVAACRREIRPRELELLQVGGRPYYLCRQSPRDSRLVAADGAGDADGAAGVQAVPALTAEAVLAAGAPLWAGQALTRVSIIRGGDGYFEADAGAAPTDDSILRVDVRVDADTPADSTQAAQRDGEVVWYYFDRRAGTIASRLDGTGRLERWLYHGFHGLDFPLAHPSLRAHGTIWYVVILGLSTLGLFFSVSGVVLALAWLARVRRRRRDAGRPAV